MLQSDSIYIHSTAQRVFAVYSDVSSWPKWDNDVSYVTLPDGLVHGSEGWLKPSSGPRVKIRVTQVTKNVSFSTESRLPLCTMTVYHEINPAEQGVRITHGARFSGLLAPLFKAAIGRPFSKNLPVALQALKSMSEATN
jgi:hypothetical protein